LVIEIEKREGTINCDTNDEYIFLIIEEIHTIIIKKR